MANRFWRGGSGTWDNATTTNWSTSTGGAGGASAPTSADDAIVDANSGGGTITIAATATCQSLDSTNAAACTMAFSTTGILTIGSASGGKLAIGTNVTITGSGAAGALSFVSTSTNSGAGWPITSNGKTMPVMTFNGAGGRWQLQDNLTVTSGGSGLLTLTAGTLDLNAKSVTGWKFSGNGGTLIGAGSTVTLSATTTAWSWTAGTLTSSPTSIVCSGTGTTFAGGGKPYTALTLSGTGTQAITGNNTFGTLTRSAATAVTTTLPAGGTQTITTSLVCTGTSGNLKTINSSAAGTQSTINNATGGAINLDWLSLQDVTAYPANTIGGGSNTTYGSNVNGWVHGSATLKPQATQLSSKLSRTTSYRYTNNLGFNWH